MVHFEFNNKTIKWKQKQNQNKMNINVLYISKWCVPYLFFYFTCA